MRMSCCRFTNRATQNGWSRMVLAVGLHPYWGLWLNKLPSRSLCFIIYCQWNGMQTVLIPWFSWLFRFWVNRLWGCCWGERLEAAEVRQAEDLQGGASEKAPEMLGPQDPPLLLTLQGGRHHFRSMEKTTSLKTAKSFLTLTFLKKFKTSFSSSV